MEEQMINKFLAIAAIVLAVVALGMIAMQPAQQVVIQGANFDPAMQASVLQMKEPISALPYSGLILTNQKINTTGGTGTPYVGQIVFLSGATWIKADPASAATLAGKLGMVAKKPTTNISSDGHILITGLVYNSSWSLTKGTVYYANTTTPGTFNVVKPTDSTVVQPLGYAFNTSVFFFNPAVNATANGI